jgi:hypothetical protein
MNDSAKFDGPKMIETAQDKLLELKARRINDNVIHERPQDMEHEQTQPMSKLRKLSDTGMDCQWDGTRDAKQRKLDVSITDGPTLKTIFVNTPSRNFQHSNTYRKSDQDYSDEVSTATNL